MPDLPSSIANPTLSDDSLFALNLDTKMRFDNINAGFQNPMSLPNYEVERKSMPQSDLLNNDLTKGTIGDSIFNPDRKIADMANKALQDRLSTRSTKIGVGVPELFNYDKVMDRYLDQSAGYNPYTSIEDNEAYYYQKYLSKNIAGRFFSSAGKGISRFATGVALKTIQTIGLTGALIGNGIQEIFDPSGNDAMADIADNSLSRWAENTENEFKNSSLLAVFKPRDWAEKGFFSKLGSAAFWADEVADGAAFMGEMVLSTYLLGGAGKLAGLSKLGATSINTASKLGKAGKALDYGIKALIKALTGAKDISGLGRWAFLTASESAMEASEKYKATKEKYENARKAGKNTYSDDQIRHLSGEAAASAFKDNMMILALSNSFENRFIFEPIFGKGTASARGGVFRKLIGISDDTSSVKTLARAERQTYKYNNAVSRFTDWKNPNSRLRFYGSRSLKAIGAEGYWEENAQLATERLSADEAYQKGSFLERKLKLAEKVLKQAQSASPFGGEFDPEAETSIGLGGLIGMGGTGLVAKVAGGDRYIYEEKDGKMVKTKNRMFEGERQKMERDANDAIKVYEDARRSFLNFQDIHQRDTDGRILKDEFGNPKIDTNKAKGLLDGIFKFTNKLDQISTISDPLFKKYLQDDALGTYVMAAKSIGIFDKAVRAFDTLNTIDPKQLEELGFDPSTITDHSWMQNSIKRAGEIWDEVYNRPGNEIKEGQTSADEANRKSVLYNSRLKVESANKIAGEYLKSMSETNFSFILSESAINSPEVQKYNSLTMQEMRLAEFESMASENTDFFNEHIKSEKDRIAAEKAEIEPLLKDRIDRGELNEKDGIVLSFAKYAGLTEKEARDTIAIEQEAQMKHAELTNTAAQYSFLANKLSVQDGIANLKKWQEYMNSIKKKDEVVDAETESETEVETETELETKTNDYNIVPNEGTFDVYNPEGQALRTFQTQEDAQAFIDNIKKEAEALAAKEAEKKAAKEAQEKLKEGENTYEELKKVVISIIEEKTGQGITDNELSRIADLIAGPGSALFNEEELDILSQFVVMYNERMKGPVEEIESYGYKIRLEPDGKWKIYTIDGESLGLTFDTKELAIQDALISDIRRRREEELIELDKKIPSTVVPNRLKIQRQAALDEINTRYDTELAEALGTKVSVPVMITNKMVDELKDLGWLEEQINKMKPQEAHDYINSKQGPPVPPTPEDPIIDPTDVPESILEQIRNAFRLHEQALLNETSFEEEAKKEGLIIHNNKIDDAIDGAKTSGRISFVTSNPRELKKDNKSLITEDSDVFMLRHNFLARIANGSLDKNDFKLSLQVSPAGFIYGVISDREGKVIHFDKDANVVKTGLHLEFFLDYDLYDKVRLGKPRNEVTGFGPIAPLTSTPFILHKSFLKNGQPREDVLDILKARISKQNVLANLDSVLQGLLVREGITNEYSSIPKGKPIRSATELIDSNQSADKKGEIPIDDEVVNGIFMKANRIHFRLWRDINDHTLGTETVEFRPRSLGEVINYNGKKLVDSINIDINGESISIFEAGLKGILPSEQEYINTLKSLLRPDKFLVLNMGNTTMIINLKNFRKFVTSNKISAEELRSLTTMDDILNSELNITKPWYDNNSSVQLIGDILDNGNYMKFINDNSMTSTIPVRKSDTSTGTARINRRIIVTLDENFEDMIKKENQEEQFNLSPDITSVEIPIGEIGETEKIEAINEGKDIEPDILDDELTKTDC